MLQAVIKKGGVEIIDTTIPSIDENSVLIRVLYSCVSYGTETSTISDSGKSLFQKAKEKPEKVKKVIDKVLSEGPLEALAMVKGELNIRSASGYSLSGEVIRVGSSVHKIAIGDLVAAAGATANHAEVVSVPQMLVTKISNKHFLQQASTVALGSIALHGVRRAGNNLGEQCVVIGTGIIGLITVQILVRSGVRVCAIDIDKKKLTLAKMYGTELTYVSGEDTVNNVVNWSHGLGVDSVIICASSNNHDIISQAFQMSRRKGKVILVGSVGMNLNRSDIYKKEVDFQISTSYGPGRYDHDYEVEGNDYPLAYVRWTEGRNMQEYVRLIETGQINLDKMITSVYNINEAQKAFDRSQSEDLDLVTLIQYDEKDLAAVSKLTPSYSSVKGKVNVGIIGAGGFTKSMLLPNLKKQSKYFQFRSIYSRTGVKAKDLLEHFNGTYLSPSVDDLLNDPEIDLVIITTNHDSHGEYVLQALQSGKNVFVEKPLTTDIESLRAIQNFYSQTRDHHPFLTVGFNRRFSAYAQEIKKHASKRINPIMMFYRMNAGHLPSEHWVHRDGGRIIGECCHILDLASFFMDSKIKSISYDYLTPSTDHIQSSDNRAITCKYEDGSIVQIQYFSVGNTALSKEYFEIHFDQKSFIVDDYKSLESHGVKAKNISHSKSQKGHLEMMEALGKHLTSKSNDHLIPLDSIFETTEATFKIAEN